MNEPDTWARMTPYEVGIPGREFADRTFAAVREEAETRGVDPTDPGSFVLLGEVGRALREIQGEERGGEAIHHYGAILFHAYHFHLAGEPLLLLDTAVTRTLVESDPADPGWTGELPSDAGYVQLPRHLFWAHPEGDADAAEPVDGVFWTRVAGDHLALLVALGIRAGRPGVSVMELPPVPLSDAGEWLTRPAREEGRDFATTLPGGELDRLYSIVSMGEVLKLVGRILAYLAAVPEALGPRERGPRPGEVDENAARPRPSLLPFRRVREAGPGIGGVR